MGNEGEGDRRKIAAITEKGGPEIPAPLCGFSLMRQWLFSGYFLYPIAPEVQVCVTSAVSVTVPVTLRI